MAEMTRKRVAILATNGFEEVELFEPKEALERSGAKVDIIAPQAGKIKAWNKDNWGREIKVDRTIDEASPKDYDALMLPGGVINPDKLRTDEGAVRFVRSFFEERKPVAAICHGPQMLIEANVVQGRRMTSYPSIKKDLMNAGAQWVDEEVVVDEGLVTSRSPEDLDAFNEKMIEEVHEGKHEGQHV